MKYAKELACHNPLIPLTKTPNSNDIDQFLLSTDKIC